MLATEVRTGDAPKPQLSMETNEKNQKSFDLVCDPNLGQEKGKMMRNKL